MYAFKFANLRGATFLLTKQVKLQKIITIIIAICNIEVRKKCSENNYHFLYVSYVSCVRHVAIQYIQV